MVKVGEGGREGDRGEAGGGVTGGEGGGREMGVDREGDIM